MGIMVFLLGVFALLVIFSSMSGRPNRNSKLDQSTMNNSSYYHAGGLFGIGGGINNGNLHDGNVNFSDDGHCNDGSSWGGSDGGGSFGGSDGGGGFGGGDGGCGGGDGGGSCS